MEGFGVPKACTTAALNYIQVHIFSSIAVIIRFVIAGGFISQKDKHVYPR